MYFDLLWLLFTSRAVSNLAFLFEGQFFFTCAQRVLGYHLIGICDILVWSKGVSTVTAELHVAIFEGSEGLCIFEPPISKSMDPLNYDIETPL